MGSINYGLYVELEIIMKNMYDDKDTEKLFAFKDRTMRKNINGWKRIYTYSNKETGFIGYIYEKNGTPLMISKERIFGKIQKIGMLIIRYRKEKSHHNMMMPKNS